MHGNEYVLLDFYSSTPQRSHSNPIHTTQPINHQSLFKWMLVGSNHSTLYTQMHWQTFMLSCVCLLRFYLQKKHYLIISNEYKSMVFIILRECLPYVLEWLKHSRMWMHVWFILWNFQSSQLHSDFYEERDHSLWWGGFWTCAPLQWRTLVPTHWV